MGNRVKREYALDDSKTTLLATAYVPDLFVSLFYVTLFSSAVALDILLVFFLIFNSHWLATLIFAISLFPHSICELLMDRKKTDECLSGYVPNRLFHVVFYLLGFGSIFTTTRILMDTFEMNRRRMITLLGFPYPFFRISNENLSTIKMYCCIHLVLKSIPQLFITSVFILGRHVTGAIAIVLGANILLNILIFCQTIATTFPIRKSPRVFTNSTCVLFNAFNKFMATMCACCVHLTIFAVVFKRYKYYAVLIVLLKAVLWIVPCWRMLRDQPIPICRICFAVYFTFISLVFSIIYVHAFEGLGKFYYYLLYLVGLLYELFVIYLVADANLESISYYLTLKILMFGFLSCFGLLNILHKYRESKLVWFTREKSLEMMSIDYKDVESNEDAGSGEKKENVKSGENNEAAGSSQGKGVSSRRENGGNDENGGNVKDKKNIEIIEDFEVKEKLSSEEVKKTWRGIWRWK